MEMTFFISLSIEEALERISKKVDCRLGAWKSDPYKIETPDGKEMVSIVYRRYYGRTGRELALLTVMDTITGKTRIHFTSDGSETVGIDLGAAVHFQNWMKKVLGDCVLPEHDLLKGEAK